METRLKAQGMGAAQRAAAVPSAADLFPEGAEKRDPRAVFEDLVGCKEVRMREGRGWRGLQACCETASLPLNSCQAQGAPQNQASR